eukprot:2179536-Prymnesium_polylepis.1
MSLCPADCPLKGMDCAFAGSSTELLASARNVSLGATAVRLLAAYEVGGDPAGGHSETALLSVAVDTSAAMERSYDITADLGVLSIGVVDSYTGAMLSNLQAVNVSAAGREAVRSILNVSAHPRALELLSMWRAGAGEQLRALLTNLTLGIPGLDELWIPADWLEPRVLGNLSLLTAAPSPPPPSTDSAVQGADASDGTISVQHSGVMPTQLTLSCDTLHLELRSSRDEIGPSFSITMLPLLA